MCAPGPPKDAPCLVVMNLRWVEQLFAEERAQVTFLLIIQGQAQSRLKCMCNHSTAYVHMISLRRENTVKTDHF